MKTREMPQDVNVERSVLGSMLTNDLALADACTMLSAEVFYNSGNADIFRTIQEMKQAGEAIDVLTVSEKLSKLGKLESSGDASYLAELCESQATSQNISQYSNILHEKYIRRKIISSGEVLIDYAENIEIPISKTTKILNDFSDDISFNCDESGIDVLKKGSILTIEEMKDKVFDYYKNGLSNRGIVLTGWPNMSEHYMPARGTLVVTTGIPSHGKSSWWDALMVKTLVHGWKWLVYSPENYPYSLHVQKLSELITGLPMFGEERMSESVFLSSVDTLNSFFSFIELSEKNITLDSILDISKDYILKNNISGIIIDPWNELNVSLKDGESETDYIGRSLSRCRRFARKNNILFSIVAHPAKMIKRPGEKKYDVPTLYNISGSAHFYNKSDIGLCVYRDFENEMIDVHIQKVRFKVHGKVGTVSMRYIKSNGQFKEEVLI